MFKQCCFVVLVQVTGALLSVCVYRTSYLFDVVLMVKNVRVGPGSVYFIWTGADCLFCQSHVVIGAVLPRFTQRMTGNLLNLLHRAKQKIIEKSHA